MIRKIKTASPYFLILFLVVLLIGFNAITSKVEADDTSDTQVVVGNAAPVVSSVSFAEGDDFSLTENTTKTITVRALVTDTNGCADVWNGSVKAYMYQNSLTASCSADLDDCYLIASCSTDATRNSCTEGADTTVIMACSANIQYFAVATDATSSDSADKWAATVTATDEAGDDHSAANATQTVDIILGRALEASTSINYDAISAGSNSGAVPIEMGVRNTGNSGMDPLISATTTLTCSTAPTCGSSTIADANQKYASVSQDYSDEYNIALTGSAVQFNTNTPKPVHTTYPVDDQIFWGLGVDGGQQLGTYQGVNTFTATGD
jgi:hypothetical protein